MKKFLISIILSTFFLQSGLGLAQIIEDDVALQAFQNQNLSRPILNKETIEDETALQLKEKKTSKNQFKSVIIEDNSLKPENFKNCVKISPNYKLIDENAEIIKVFVKPTSFITTKNGLKVGEKVNFKVAENVNKNGKLFISNGTDANAVIELISSSDRFGDPDEIELGRFSTKDIQGNTIELTGNIRKEGANRGKWVKPLYYAGLSCPIFGAPLLALYFVKGGKTQIKPEQKFELYYE